MTSQRVEVSRHAVCTSTKGRYIRRTQICVRRKHAKRLQQNDFILLQPLYHSLSLFLIQYRT